MCRNTIFLKYFTSKKIKFKNNSFLNLSKNFVLRKPKDKKLDTVVKFVALIFWNNLKNL